MWLSSRVVIAELAVNTFCVLSAQTMLSMLAQLMHLPLAPCSLSQY